MSVPPSEFLQAALANGELELKGQFTFGSNYTFLVVVKYKTRRLRAVYKPMRGEQPLWDFPSASLAGREVAAYLVSRALGFDFIPFTLLRDGPLGPGSVQDYIEYDPDYHYFSFSPQDRQRLRPVALFDLLVNNADRKGSHILVQKRTGRLYLIDHGLCFHEEDKLRTVLWDFAGEAIPADLLAAVSGLLPKLAAGAELRTALQEYLSQAELAALADRAQGLLRQAIFPDPPPGRRAFPYPPL